MRCIASYTTAYSCDKKRQFRMLTGTDHKVADGFFQRRIAFHGRQRIGSPCEALANAPFSAKILMSIPCSSTAMHTMDIAAENKDFVVVERTDIVRRNTISFNYLRVFHILLFEISICKSMVFLCKKQLFPQKLLHGKEKRHKKPTHYKTSDPVPSRFRFCTRFCFRTDLKSKKIIVKKISF